VTCADCPNSCLIGVNERECRADPPRVMVVHTPQGAAMTAAWPQVKSDQWCGKHPSRRDGMPIFNGGDRSTNHDAILLSKG
jgi:hypothetical protein